MGGRWNSPGNAVLYCASSLSLACLETLVHIRVADNLPPLTSTEVIVPDELITPWKDHVGLGEVGERYTRAILESLVLSREMGDLWLKSRRGPVSRENPKPILQVPSAVIPEEWNYLINPESPQFYDLVWVESKPFEIDPRLLFPDLR